MASEEPGFLVDEMLQRLGPWLRAAGYDTRIATHAEADYYLLRQAIDEGRLLLTVLENATLSCSTSRYSFGTTIQQRE